MKRLCTICARGGSKGVKNKNTRGLLEKPLIAHSILQAKESKLFESVAVSSDSVNILEIAKAWGADCLIARPDDLAQDASPKVPVIQHCVLEVEKLKGYLYDTIVDLDATAPLRIPTDIIRSVEMLENNRVSNVITGTPARRSPYFNLVEVSDAGAVFLSKSLEKPIVRRQDAPKCFDMNASIYVWRRNVLLNSLTLFNQDTMLYVMPEERSIDIDSELDFEFVEFLFRKRKIL